MTNGAKGMAVGVIGLGAMGLGIAQSLRRAGLNVHAFDVRREAARAFAGEGGAACDSPAQLAAACEVVVSAVVNAVQTEAVLFGEGGAAVAMRKGSAFMMCSNTNEYTSSSINGLMKDQKKPRTEPRYLAFRSRATRLWMRPR